MVMQTDTTSILRNQFENITRGGGFLILVNEIWVPPPMISEIWTPGPLRIGKIGVSPHPS